MNNDTARGTVEDVAGLLPTLPPVGNICGPSCRVKVTSDHKATVLQIGGKQTGYDLAGVDALIAALTQARTILADAAAPTPERVLTAAGHTKHTCTPDGKAQPFGRKAPLGECARCDELRDGAAPREDHALHRQTPATIAQDDAERRRHRATCHMCQTGGVCTAFQW